MAKSQMDFTEGFDLPDIAAWSALATSSLKGRELERVINFQPAPDMKVRALRTAADTTPASLPPRDAAPWEITAAFWNPDAEAVNEEILEDLSRGVTSISLKIASGETPGIAIDDLPRVLDGVYLDMIRVGFAAGEASPDVAEAFAAYVEAGDVSADQLKGSFGADPIGTLAQTGRLHKPLPDAISEAIGLIPLLISKLPSMTAMSANGSIYHSAGASDAMELGYILATVVDYLRAAEKAGVDTDVAARHIQLGTAIGAETFLNIAKVRALRGLWARLMALLNITDTPAWINAGSALRMMTRRDPWVNILRGTSACFSAGVGGADSVTVLPLDTLMGLPGKLGRRLARNTQIMLQEESYLTAVSDPSAGSFAIEAITSDLMQAAWQVFQSVEASGGMAEALVSGKIHADCADVAAKRQHKLATRKQVVTGVSQFALLGEKLPDDVRGYPTLPEGETTAAITWLEPLPFVLDAGAFERLRLAIEHVKLQPVPLLCLGQQAQYSARANFTRDILAAVGLDAKIIEVAHASAAEAAIERAGLAIICGSDNAYEAEAEAIIRALGDKTYLMLAGKPSNLDDLSAAGLDGTVHAGMDVIAFGEQLLIQLGGEA